jgi:hypothetical protein
MDWEIALDAVMDFVNDYEVVELGDRLELIVAPAAALGELEYQFELTPQHEGRPKMSKTKITPLVLSEPAWRKLRKLMRTLDIALLKNEAIGFDLASDTKVATWISSAGERFVKLECTSRTGATSRLALSYTAWTTLVTKEMEIVANGDRLRKYK